MSETINFTVSPATAEQLRWLREVYWCNNEYWRTAKVYRNYYVAAEENGEVLGYLVVREFPAVETLGGKNWWIAATRIIDPAKRRHGIGTALVEKVLFDAQAEGVRYLCGSVSRTSAAHFWVKQGFLLTPYGQEKANNDPDMDGNCPHLLLRRIDQDGPPRYPQWINVAKGMWEGKIRPLTSEERNHIIAEQLQKTNPGYWEARGGAHFGYIAERSGRTLGWILAAERPMGKPLAGTVWGVPASALSAEDEDTARRLLNRLFEAAFEQRVTQILCMVRPRQEAPLWERRGFALFDWISFGEKNDFMCAIRNMSDGFRFVDTKK